MKKITADNSTIINGIALGFSLAFLAVVPVAAFYTGEWGADTVQLVSYHDFPLPSHYRLL